MRVIVGLVLCILGIAGAGTTFMLNSSTPMQLGPIPFFVSCFVGLVGLIIVLIAVIEGFGGVRM